MGSEKRGKGGVSGFKVFVGIVVAMVAAVVVGGMFLAGSPGTVRSQNFDNQRLNDLQQISSAIDAYYDGNGTLPATVREVVSGGKTPYYVNSFADPETKQDYEYNGLGGSSYSLCATFALPTQADDGTGRFTKPMIAPEPYGVTPTDWTHPAGHHCFALDASTHVPPQICGLTNPCAAGQTCASLPGRRGTVCVPTGKECLAAGCPGECVIAESYPAQISCSPAAGKRPPNAEGNACDLMREKKSGKVDCYGMGKSLQPGWEPYTAPEVGIPYACFVDEKGECALAQ